MAKKILIIDDEAEVRNLFSAALIGAGYDVIVAGAKEAFFKASNERFEFIIVDLCAPQIKSIDLIEVLFSKGKNEKTHLVITSPKVSEEVFDRSSKQLFVCMLPKPITIKNLVKRISELGNETSEPKRSSGLDVRIVNPLISGAMAAIADVFGPITVGKPYLRKQAEISGDISGLIGLTSESFKGSIAISFFTTSYLKVISSKLGGEFKELNEETQDAMSEIIRMITDEAEVQFKKQSLSVLLSSPAIVTGNGHSLQHQSQSAPVVVLFQNSQNEGFRMEICTHS